MTDNNNNNTGIFEKICNIGSKFGTNITAGYTVVSGGIDSANLYGQQHFGVDFIPTNYRLAAATTVALLYSSFKTDEVRHSILIGSGNLYMGIKRISGNLLGLTKHQLLPTDITHTTSDIQHTRRRIIRRTRSQSSTLSVSSNLSNVPGAYPSHSSEALIANNSNSLSTITVNTLSNKGTFHDVDLNSPNSYDSPSGLPEADGIIIQSYSTNSVNYRIDTPNEINDQLQTSNAVDSRIDTPSMYYDSRTGNNTTPTASSLPFYHPSSSNNPYADYYYPTSYTPYLSDKL